MSTPPKSEKGLQMRSLRAVELKTALGDITILNVLINIRNQRISCQL